MNRTEVLETLTAHRNELRKRFAIKSLALFGSVARDESTDESDVDLLVEFDRPVGLFHLIGAEQHLQTLLGVRKVDPGLAAVGHRGTKRKTSSGRQSMSSTHKELETPPAAHAGSGN